MDITANEITYKWIAFRKRRLKTDKYLHLTVTLTKEEWKVVYGKRSYINNGVVPIVVKIRYGRVDSCVGTRTTLFFAAMDDEQLAFIHSFVKLVFKAKKKVPKPITINLFEGKTK